MRKCSVRPRPGRPWLLELRVKDGAIELAAENDSRTDFSIEAVHLEWGRRPVRRDRSHASSAELECAGSNAHRATVSDATTPKVCVGRIASDNGVTSQLKIQFTPLSGGQAPERRPR